MTVAEGGGVGGAEAATAAEDQPPVGLVLAAEDRLRALLAATQSVVQPLDLPIVLRRIARAAADLVDAEYGALGVIAPDRHGLEQFVYVGMTDAEAVRIGHLPEGHGLLGALITDPASIALPEISSDPRAVGFPPHHPPMHSFLGVPVRVHGEVFGNLYLTNRRHGKFTDEDTALVEALATTAGFVIANARLFAQARAREEWMTAAVELSAALLSTPRAAALDLLATRVHQVAGADRVAVLLVADDDGFLQVAAARGSDEESLRGALLAEADTFAGAVIRDALPRVAEDRSGPAADPLVVRAAGAAGPAMAIPLRSQTRLWGIVAVARAPGAAAFTPADVTAAAELGARASLALDLAHAREGQERALLADERARIARDLHDHVIQQLFGAGLTVRAVAGALEPGPAADRLDAAVGELDDAIAQIRTAIFALSARDADTLRHRVIDVVAGLSSHMSRPPTVRFRGPIDHAVGGRRSEDVVAAARELLSNAVRHADADRISVEVTARNGWLTVHVADDGDGMGTRTRRSGLQNLQDRAQRHGGDLHVESSRAGTSVRWCIPMTASETSAG
ncbi:MULTISPECIES: sensor histidine kinase [unclassified Microbacterium]|uniref:sensor histidine kinase n=1 Tax=unclassified Microbacterium TaxID=2609290 RepID=UPI0009DD8B73|nr:MULTISPECIES: GAF domain-containing protein [unclassified Microbacterium]